jgi:hypothetical protein
LSNGMIAARSATAEDSSTAPLGLLELMPSQ